MPAPTLRQLALQAAIRASDLIYDFADMPFEMAYPILKTIMDPHQLEEIEKTNPEFAGQTAECWKNLIKRDIPNWQDKMKQPNNPRNWGKVYRYMMKEEQKRIEADEEILRQNILNERLKKMEKSTLHVKKVLPHARSEDETNFYIDGVKRSEFKGRSGWGDRQPSLKNAKSGTEIVSAVRRQASEAVKARSAARPLIGAASAAAKLEEGKRQIKVAPPSMMRGGGLVIKPQRDWTPQQKEAREERQRVARSYLSPAAPKTRLSAIKTATRNAPVISQAAEEERASRQRAMNEERLRALTQPQKKSQGSIATPTTKTTEKTPAALSSGAATKTAPPNTTKAPSTATATKSTSQESTATSPATSLPPPSSASKKRKFSLFDDEDNQKLEESDAAEAAESVEASSAASSPPASSPPTSSAPADKPIASGSLASTPVIASSPGSSQPHKIVAKPKKVNIFATYAKKRRL